MDELVKYIMFFIDLNVEFFGLVLLGEIVIVMVELVFWCCCKLWFKVEMISI